MLSGFFVGFIFIGFLGVMVVIWIIQYYFQIKHTGIMKTFAAQNGWQFYETFNFPFLIELAHYTGKVEKGWFGEIIHNPLTVTSKNVIQGIMHGRAFAVFEQTYRRGSGKHSHNVSQTLFAVEVKDMNLPVFCLEPDSFTNFLSFNFKRLDIDFHTHPHFSRQYLLYGLDERAIRDLFQPSVLSFYEQSPPFTTVAGGKFLVIYQVGHVSAPAQIVHQLNFLFALVNAFKHRR